MPTKNYTGRNIDLRKLRKEIERWFIQQDYETQSKAGERDFLVQARKGDGFRTLVGATRSFTISISGTPDEFRVEFGIASWAENLGAVAVGTLLTGGLFLIGSGFAASWSKKIEADFLRWLDNTIHFSPKELLFNDKVTPQHQMGHKQSNERVKQLSAALDSGILTEQEYQEKLSQLQRDSAPESMMDKLNEAYRNGLFTEAEFLAKKGRIEMEAKIKNLESAFRNGILTKAEYEKKLEGFDNDVEFID